MTLVNVIRISPTAIYSNDKKVSEEKFSYLLDVIARNPELGPDYELEVNSATDCSKVAAVRVALNKAIDCSSRCWELSEEDRAKFEASLPKAPLHR